MPTIERGNFENPEKSAYNFEVYDSGLERRMMERLEKDHTVRKWTKKHGIVIPWIDTKGKRHNYRPDFLVEYVDGSVGLIEVKGKGRLWDNDEVVELSRAQIHEAFAMSGGKDIGLWYLYVVERMDDGSYSVLPIENPVDVAGKWILCGGSWRMIADEPRKITIE